MVQLRQGLCLTRPGVRKIRCFSILVEECLIAQYIELLLMKVCYVVRARTETS
jgi:hypothetical protein